MEYRDKQILQQNRKSLVGDIAVSVILNHLIQSNILNNTLTDEILSKKTRQEKVEALLDTLPRRGPRAFQEFCFTLRENYEWLAEKLELAVTTNTTDVMSGLNPIFLCPRCSHFYDEKQHEPKLLPCNHGYCLDCIMQLAGRSSSYQCPICQVMWELPQGGASSLSRNEYVIQSQKHVRQHTDDGKLPTVYEIVSVTPHPVSGIPEDIQITVSGPQENLKLAVTNPEGKTVYIPVQKIRSNIYKAKYRGQIKGLYQARVVTNDNIVLLGGKCEFAVGSNNPVWTLGSKGSGLGQFDNPRDVAVDRDGNMYVSDSINYRIVKISPLGKYISSFELINKEENKKNVAIGVTINNKEQEIVCTKGYVDDKNTLWGNTIQVYTMQGMLKNEYINADMRLALHSTVNSRGQIIVNDNEMDAIFIGSRQGEHIQWERVGKKGQGPGELWSPAGITTGPDDDIVVCEYGNTRVQVLDRTGCYKHHFGGKGQELGMFLNPTCAAVDEDNNILVSDWEKSVIQIFSYEGEFISCIDSEADALNVPYGLAVTGDGHVIVTEHEGHCIKKYKYK